MRTPFRQARRLVRGTGPPEAAIILVGEAPGRDEQFYGEPFVGPAGRLQAEEGWGPVAIRRSDIRLENVVEERPDGNRIEGLSPKTVRYWQSHCHRRLDQLIEASPVTACARVVVPVGNLALNTLLRAELPIGRGGRWRTRTPAGIQWPYKISQYRGSLLEYVTDSGVPVRMIPTIHPASFLYGNTGFEAWRGDWRRIAAEVAAGCPPPLEGVDVIAESGRWGAAWLADAEARGTEIAVDLETAGAQLLCAGVAQSAEESLVLPLLDPESHTPIKWGWFWLARILASDLVKVTWNGLFDTFLLRWHRLPVHRWRWDAMAEHHLLDPSDRHTLAYCASRDLRTVFWKEEAKETEVGPRGGLRQKTAHWEQFLAYCGKDARHTIALHRVYQARLEQAGLLPTYRRHYRRVMWAALDLSLEGIMVDQAERDRLHQLACSELERLRHAITEAAGGALTTGPRILRSGKPSKAKQQPKGGLSNPAILRYFYETLKCKPYMKGGKRTANEVAVRRLGLKYKKAAPVADLLLRFRHQEKVAQFTAPQRLDRDGRLRGLYRPLTTTGRLRAQTPPTGIGTNPQNQLRSIRSMFVASSPDHVLAEIDLSQAEARIVDGASGHPDALVRAQASPLDLDQHREMAAALFGKALEEVTDRERELGKRSRHASAYGMEGARFSEILLTETESAIVLTPEECQELLDGVLRARPYIATWQAWVREHVIKRRRLVNSWGRHLLFLGRTLSKEDYKEAYAWGPQSEVACLLIQMAWLPCWSMIKRRGLQTRIIHQGHDSLMFDGPPSEVWALVRHAVELVTAPRTYPGVRGRWELAMPAGLKIGRHWGAGMIRSWPDARRVTWEEWSDAEATPPAGDGGRLALHAGGTL
jgi:uracil-DNA glycosylase family 4